MRLFSSKVDRAFRRFCFTGDPDSLGQVFDATAGHLTRVALWLMRSRQDAEDLVQRTFLQAIALRTRYEPSRRALPWLLALLSRQALKIRRERARKVPRVTRTDDVVDPLVEVAVRELDEAIATVRQTMVPQYREVLKLHLEEGLAAHEISTRLGRPAGTVRTQLVRALEQLRQRLPKGMVPGLLATGFLGQGAVGVSATRAHVLRVAGEECTLAPLVRTASLGRPVWMAIGTAASMLTAAFVWTMAASGVDVDPSPRATNAGPIPSASIVAAHLELAESRGSSDDLSRSTRREVKRSAIDVELRWAGDEQPAVGQVLECIQPHHPLARWQGVTDVGGKVAFDGIAPGSAWIYQSGEPPTAVVVESESRHSLVLRRKRGVGFEGLVRDDRGPVPGAKLLLRGNGDEWAVPIAQTDAGGRVRVDVPTNSQLSVASSAHLPSAEFTIADRAGIAVQHEFRLVRGGASLRVRVVSEAGLPLAGARVVAAPRRSDASAPDRTDTTRAATASEDGLVSWDGMAADAYELRAWARGFGPCVARASLREASNTELDLRLVTGGTVRGVVRSKSGAPVAHAHIRSEHYLGPWDVGDFTDTDGKFSIEDLPPGPVSLLVRSRELGQAVAQFTLASGSVTEWDPVLDPGRILGGRVIDQNGRGLRGQRVRGSWSGVADVFTEFDGRFRFFGVPVGPHDLEVATTTGVVLARASELEAPRDDVVLEVLDPQSASIRGRVLDERGMPYRCSVLIGAWIHPTDSRGEFTATHLPAGEYAIAVRLANGEQCWWRVVEVANDGEVDLGDWRPGSEALRVRVQLPNGRPATGSAKLFLPGELVVGTANIEGGCAVFARLRAGRHLVRCSADRLEGEFEVDVPLQGAEPVVRMERRTLCKIRCAGATAGNATVVARSLDGKFRRRIRVPVTDEFRSGSSILLPRGQVLLTATTERGWSGELDCVVPDRGGDEEVELITIPLEPRVR